MRLKNPRSFLVFYAFVQVTWAYHHAKYADNIKNGQRTNPKKYRPTSVAVSVNVNHHPEQFRNSKLDTVPTSGTLLKISDRTLKNNNNKLRYSGSGHPVRHRHGWMMGTTTTTTTTTTPSPEEELFNNYGDFYDGDYPTEDDYSEDVFEATNNDFYDEFQAEEPSTSTERSTPAPRLSDFGNFKYKFLGTREKVRQARADFLQTNKKTAKMSSQERQEAAVDHYFQVLNTGKCQKPILKVIPVHIEHPNSSVSYVPHCTVLHRCAEDTGCCENDATCQYKKREEVTLYFYVTRFGIEHYSVEKLTFFNHTECECRKKTDDTEKPPNTTERGKRVADFSFKRPTFTYKPLRTKGNEPQSLTKKCMCPKEFLPKIDYKGKCTCDCDLSNDGCIRMKQGKEYNSLIDRRCIENQDCGTVLCEYGSYNRTKGRCPKFDE